jgi:hypothetical protein
MSFPEWGFSYNALHVPLTSDWQCSLVPTRDVQDVDCGRKLTPDERRDMRKVREARIEQDRQDFDRLFRVATSRRAARSCRDFSEYVAFIRDQVCGSGSAVPVDGESVTRILREAVRDGQLTPAISRAWRGSRRVARPYAPQSWPRREPDPKPTIYSFRNGQLVPLDKNGYFIDDTPYIPKSARLTAATRNFGHSNDGTDWLGTVEIAAKAMVGGDLDSSAEYNQDSMFKRLTDPGGSDGLLADAQPFEYQPDMPGGDTFDIAKTPNLDEPGTWYTNPGSGQMRLFGSNGKPVVDLDFDHVHNGLRPHAHNWGPNGRDTGYDVVPFSPWSY